MTPISTAAEERAVQYSLGRRVLLAVVPWVAAWILRALAGTLRFEEICEEGAAPAVAGRADIWCFWHQCLLTSACYFKNRYSTSILISRSFDGELIARTIHRLGFLTARGSSTRGGSSGLRALARQQRNGSHVVFPADGPRGPRYQLKGGAIKLAQMTGASAGSFYALPEKAWQLHSWDGFLIPKPFSKVVIAWARPILVTGGLDEAGFEMVRLQVEAGLERARLMAKMHFAQQSVRRS